MNRKLLLTGVLAAAVAALIVLLSGAGKMADTTKSQALQFNVKDIQGQDVQLDPQKTNVMFFMAAWCTSCNELEHNLKQLANDPNVQVITVDVDSTADTKEALAEFQKKYGGPWAHVLDTDSVLLQKFQINSLDTVIIVKNGQIVHRSIRPSLKTIQEVVHAKS
ncbi:TlpA family protein disulfide reductase [Effusibacillus pohliae]|uniref:TlpA family protein disulfide reductase n=1 Tax=Effusibacillus pohliae TaxID=232270 RepID=UPI0003822439|nr:TlpA disulfide reductase family protein [Effusibacillus pohliae]